MGQFYVLYCRRSDGKLHSSLGSKKEANEPTTQQMDATPDKDGKTDFYRLIDTDETKHLDWRRKLGGMLSKELRNLQKPGDPPLPPGPFIVDELPTHYRLYEHIKSRAPGDGEESKTHAGGGHDRQDAYLYGHPAGRKKRYRSPADFFPHLLWLCTDESGDSKNCSCKICCPDDLQPAPEPKPLKSEKNSHGVGKKEEQDVKTGPVAPLHAQHPVVIVPAKPNTASVRAAPTSTGPSTAAQAPINKPSAAQAQAPGPSPLPQPRSLEQQLDSQYNGFVFRNGELVWFQKDGSAWGLGVIIRRWATKTTASGSKRYLVQPLSYPHDTLRPKVLDSETFMRPWLAWSAPPLTHAGLQRMPITFDNADWNRILSGAFGAGDPVIDASILAAKAIDGSYTLIEPVRDVPQNQDSRVQLRSWNGIYLGAERVWIGDVVRTRSNSNEDVLVVTAIIEQMTQTPVAGAGAPKMTTSVKVMGDMYTCVVSSTTAPSDPQLEKHLPQRMREDLRLRSEIAKAFNRPKLIWQPLEFRKSIDVTELRGRWYESTALLPILDGQAVYEQNRRAGRVETVAGKLNNRNDCNRGSQQAQHIRRAQRRDAFGAAVPPTSMLYENVIAEPTPQELQSILQPAPQPAFSAAASQAEPNLDAYVNFDMSYGQ